MNNLVVFREFSSRPEAEIVSELLNANGMDALVNSDDCGGLDPALQFGQGAQVLIAEGDVARAEQLLLDSIAQAAAHKPHP